MRTVVSIPRLLEEARSAFRRWVFRWRNAQGEEAESEVRGQAEEVVAVAANVTELPDEPNGAALTRFIDWVRKASYSSEPLTGNSAISFLWCLIAMAHEGTAWASPPPAVTRLIDTGFLQRYLDRATVDRISADNRRLQERLATPPPVNSEESFTLDIPGAPPADTQQTTSEGEVFLRQFAFYRRWVSLFDYLYSQAARREFASLAITLPERRYFAAGMASAAIQGYLPTQVSQRIVGRRRGDQNYFRPAWAIADPWAQLRLFLDPCGEPDPPVAPAVGFMGWLLGGSSWSDFQRMLVRLRADSYLAWVVGRVVLGFDFAQEHTDAWSRKSELRKLMPTPALARLPEAEPFNPRAAWVPDYLLRLLEAAQNPEGWFAGGVARYERPFFYWYPVAGPPQVSLGGERDYTPDVPDIPFEDIRLQETTFLLRLWDRLYGRNEAIESWRRNNWQIVGHAQAYQNRLEIARRMGSTPGE